MSDSSIPVSIIVVSHNEGHLLDLCLKPLIKCDEIILVDLESTDNTLEIVQKWEVKYLKHKKEPIVEKIREWAAGFAKNKWILFVDPDEVVDPRLLIAINKILQTDESQLACISLPYQYYFLNHPLRGTVWGGNKQIVRMIHKDRCTINHQVHEGFEVIPPYEKFDLRRGCDKNLVVHHYWVTDKRLFEEKHKRYLRHEGERLHVKGRRYSALFHHVIPILSFVQSYIFRRGFMDGFMGIYLSYFWAMYQYKSHISLKDYERSIQT